MLSTRAGAASSKSSEAASSDWSINTPSEATSSASVTSRSTLTKRSPPPTRRSSPAQRNTAATESSSRVATAAPRIDEESPDLARHSSLPIQRNLERSIADQDTGSAPTSREGSPHVDKPTQNTDSYSHSERSSHRRKAEARARLAVALKELELAEARSKVAQAELELIMAESEDGADEEMYVQTEVENWVIETRAKPGEQKPRRSEKKSDIQELAQVLLQISDKSRDIGTPKQIELPYFSGSCEEWLAFRRTYEDTAASSSKARLRRAVHCSAKEAVQSLMFTAEDPQDVIKGLKSRFGRPGALALAELEKMKSLPRVSEHPGDICVFASKVRNSIETIKALKKPQYLCSPETLKAVTEKMPPLMKFRWFAYHRGRREDVPELLLVQAFLEVEADMCGDFAPPEAMPEQNRIMKKPVHTL